MIEVTRDVKLDSKYSISSDGVKDGIVKIDVGTAVSDNVTKIIVTVLEKYKGEKYYEEIE